MKVLRLLLMFSVFLCSQSGNAHDLWIETSNAYVRTSDAVTVAFKLGNCDEGRRDFRTKEIVDKSRTAVKAVSPSGDLVDLTKKLLRSSNDAANGYWIAVVPIDKGGTNWFVQSLDQTIAHDGREMRGIVTSKAFVIAGESPLPSVESQVNQLLKLPVEFELLSNAFPSMEENSTIRIRFLVDSRPIEGVSVSFLPQGVDLKAEDDSSFEVRTDRDGIAEFHPPQASLYLISARHIAPNVQLTGPLNTYYSTSLTLRVSNRCVGGTATKMP